MGRYRQRNRQKALLTYRMTLIIATSVFFAASLVLIVVFYLGETRDSHAFSTGDYRTSASGNWDDTSIWEVFDGNEWQPAPMPPLHDIGSVIISSGESVTLTDEIVIKNLVIEKGGRCEIESNNLKLVKKGGSGGLTCNGELWLGTTILEGDGDIFFNPGSVIRIGSDAGISKKGNSGNIQTRGKREFSREATYVYNGTIRQHTGNGIPTAIETLVIDNASDVVLDQSVNVNGAMRLKRGTLYTGFNFVTLGTSTSTLASLEWNSGSVCGRLKSWYNQGQITLPLSDGYRTILYNFTSDVVQYQKGMVEMYYHEGTPDDTHRSPYEARHVIVGISGNGYYSANLSNGPDEAWLRRVQPAKNGEVNWNISSRTLKTTSGSEKEDQMVFTNLVTGPDPFYENLVVRFYSASAEAVFVMLTGPGGKPLKSEKFQAKEGYNQVILTTGNDIPEGDFTLQISSASGILTSKVSRSKSGGKASLSGRGESESAYMISAGK